MTQTEEKDAIIKRANDEKLIIYFTATFCGPCRAMAPIIEQVKDQINVIKVDIEEAEYLSNLEGIRAVPTFILYKKGIEVDRKVGVLSSSALTEMYNS